MEDISMIVLAMLQFDNFSDSRWLGAGPSCRCLVRALLVGLESLVAFTRKDKHVSEHHISGFDKLSETSRRFVCVCSMVSYIPEAFQVEVFEDPRIPMRVDAVHSVVLEEASWLLSLPEHFWSILASSIGTPAAKLRHEAASAAMVCCAFLERRVFRAARQAPWCLCQGSIEENLRALCSGEAPQDDTTKKIWQLLQLGFPMPQLVAAVKLLQSCPWSICMNEQMHGQQAALRKLHRACTRRVITARSMVSLLRPMLAMSPEDRRRSELRRKLGALDKKKPERMSGIDVFVREAMSLAAVQYAGTEGFPRPVRLQIMARSAAEYAALDGTRKHAYESLVRAHGLEKRADVEAKKAYLRAQASLGTLRLAEEEADSFDLRLSSCRFSATEADNLARLAMSEQFSRTKLVALRAKAMQAPMEPSHAVRALVASQQVQGPPPICTRRPNWLAPMCVHRDYFRDTALVFETEEGTRHYYGFVFAVQRPYLVCLVPLQRREPSVEAARLSEANFEEVASRHYTFAFSVSFEGFVFDAQFPFGEYSRAFLVRHMHFLQEGPFVSTCPEVPLDDFLAMLPGIASAADDDGDEQARGNERASTMAETVRQFPWLARFVGGDGDAAGERGAVETSGGEEEAEIADLPNEEDVLQDVFAELHEKRLELLGDVVRREAFPVRLLGGNWSARQHGVPYASFQAATWTAAVQTFCNTYGLPKSAKFEISLYGEAGASTMCHAWSKKMQHLYSCFLDGGGEGVEFTEEHRCTDLGAEFEALAAGLVGRARMRADQLRDIAPVNPHMR